MVIDYVRKWQDENNMDGKFSMWIHVHIGHTSRNYYCSDRHLYRNICFTTSCPETLNSCDFRLCKRNNQEISRCLSIHSIKKLQKRNCRHMPTVTLSFVFVQSHHDVGDWVTGWIHYTDVILTSNWDRTTMCHASGIISWHWTCWHVEEFALLCCLVSAKSTNITLSRQHACRNITSHTLKWYRGPHLVAAGDRANRHMLCGTCPLCRQSNWSHCPMTVVLCWHVQEKTQIRFYSWKTS